MNEKLSARLHAILPRVYHEQEDTPGTSRLLSEAQGLADEVIILEAKLEAKALLLHRLVEIIRIDDETIRTMATLRMSAQQKEQEQ